MLIMNLRSSRFKKIGEKREKRMISEDYLCRLSGVTQKPRKRSFSSLSLPSLFFSSRPRDLLTRQDEGRNSSPATCHAITTGLKIKILLLKIKDITTRKFEQSPIADTRLSLMNQFSSRASSCMA